MVTGGSSFVAVGFDTTLAGSATGMRRRRPLALAVRRPVRQPRSHPRGRSLRRRPHREPDLQVERFRPTADHVWHAAR